MKLKDYLKILYNHEIFDPIKIYCRKKTDSEIDCFVENALGMKSLEELDDGNPMDDPSHSIRTSNLIYHCSMFLEDVNDLNSQGLFDEITANYFLPFGVRYIADFDILICKHYKDLVSGIEIRLYNAILWVLRKFNNDWNYQWEMDGTPTFGELIRILINMKDYWKSRVISIVFGMSEKERKEKFLNSDKDKAFLNLESFLMVLIYFYEVRNSIQHLWTLVHPISMRIWDVKSCNPYWYDAKTNNNNVKNKHLDHKNMRWVDVTIRNCALKLCILLEDKNRNLKYMGKDRCHEDMVSINYSWSKTKIIVRSKMFRDFWNLNDILKESYNVYSRLDDLIEQFCTNFNIKNDETNDAWSLPIKMLKALDIHMKTFLKACGLDSYSLKENVIYNIQIFKKIFKLCIYEAKLKGATIREQELGQIIWDKALDNLIDKLALKPYLNGNIKGPKLKNMLKVFSDEIDKIISQRKGTSNNLQKIIKNEISSWQLQKQNKKEES